MSGRELGGWWKPAVGCIVIVAAAGIIRLTREPRAIAPPQVPSSELAALEGELQALRADVAAVARSNVSISRAQSELEKDVKAAREVGGSPSPAPDDTEIGSETRSTVDDDVAGEAAIAEEKVATVARFKRLAEELTLEPRDAKWAAETENAYRTQIEAVSHGDSTASPDLWALECKTDLCRADIRFATEAAARAFASQMSVPPSIRRGTLRRDVVDGRSRLEVFLARGDRSLHPLHRAAND